MPTASQRREQIAEVVERSWRERQAELEQVLAGKKSPAEFLGLSGANVPGLCGFAAQLLADDDVEGAEATAELATLLDGKSFPAWMVLGAARARRDDEEGALEAYGHAAEINSSHPRLWCDVGELKLILLDYAGAAKAFSLAIDADPKAATPAGKRAQYLVAKTVAKLSKK
jgi:Flp pilus assembly protein TadD